MVSRAADTIDLRRNTKGVSLQTTDRWTFVFMAALFLVTVLVGFVPSSLGKIAAIQVGQRLPFPPVLHIHAMLMGSWLLLLLAQASLVATDRRAIHQKLGLVSLALVPAMVVVGIVLVPTMFRATWSLGASPLPELDPAAIAQARTFVANLVPAQIRAGILFPTFVGWALLVRKKDPGTHKRLMILATALPLPAAIDRIGWLPTTLPGSATSVDLYMLLWVFPMLAYDLVRHRRVHRAYIIWFAVSLPLTIAVHLLWGSPWWLATAPKLMGVEGW